VTPAPTALALAAPPSAQVGETLQIFATLTRSTDNALVDGLTLALSIDGVLVDVGTTGSELPGTVEFGVAMPLGSAGSHTLTVDYAPAGAEAYQASSASSALTIEPADCSLTVDAATGAIGAQIPLKAHFFRTTDGATPANRTVHFSINTNGNTWVTAGDGTTDNTGAATLAYTIPDTLGVGAKPLRATFDGNADEASATGQSTLTAVQAKSSLLVKPASGVIGTVVPLIATLTRQPGIAPIVAARVTFTVAGSSVGWANTDTTGTARVNYTVAGPAGAPQIQATYAGTAAIAGSSGTNTLTVTTVATTLSATGVTGSIGATVALRATLTPAVSGKSIAFTVGGVSAGSVSTNKSGVAVVNYVIPEGAGAGTRPIVASFAGDSGYSSSTGSATLTVNKGTVAVTAPSAKSVTRGSTISLTAYLRRSPGMVGLSGRTLTFTLDSTRAMGTATTNSSGAATLTYTVPTTTSVGTHTITVSFAGDTWYASGSANGTLTVK